MSKVDPIADPHGLLRPTEASAILRASEATVARLRRDEGLPCIILGRGPAGREIVRFRLSEILAWLDSRRENQIRRTISGDRFSRRRPA